LCGVFFFNFHFQFAFYLIDLFNVFPFPWWFWSRFAAAVMSTGPLSQYTEMCNEIAGNIPLLVQLLESEFPPEQVCSMMHQCPASLARKLTLTDCELCVSLVESVIGAAAQGMSVEEITESMNNLCIGECVV
jgi:hypothetical protein